MSNIAMIVSAILVALALAGVLTFIDAWMRPVRRILGFHVWRYRNPHDRTCETCGRNQVEFHMAGEPRKSWWETFKEGNGMMVVCRQSIKQEPSA